MRQTTLEKKKRRSRIRLLKIRRAIFLTFCFSALVIGLVFVFRFDSIYAFRQRKIASEAKIPDYVDIQLLDIGKARTGIPILNVKNIVVHYVGNPNTSAQNNRDYFAKKDTEVSSHFVVGLEGEIIQCVPLDEKSSASNWRNKDTISIEVCHPDETGKFTDVTTQSLVKLTAWLCKTFHLSEQDILRHYDITGKECPRYFVQNEAAYQEFLQQVKDKIS